MRGMAFCNLLIFTTCVIAIANCEDCVYSLQHQDKEFLFDLISFKDLQSVNFTKDNDPHTINIVLCNKSEPKSNCDGIKSKICLIRKKTNQTDIGSKIKEIKLDAKNQLVMTLEGNKLCEKNKKHITDLIFICRKSVAENKIILKSSDNCKYILEVFSLTACPVDDLDIRKSCSVLVPHSNYMINLSPLRRHLTNYLVENQNRRFEINICGRLTDNNKCGGNITTICDVTDESSTKVYAVGYNKNDQLLFDNESRNLKLIQHEKATSKKKGRRIEIVFKCNESITPEKTKPEFLNEDNYPFNKKSSNVAHFEVATSTVCIPRITSCEIFKDNFRFNLKPLHKRVGNWLVINYRTDGKFYLNVCGYLNQYGEEIPRSCSVDRKTSACYVNSSGIGISIGSSQIGPHFVGNSLQLNYIDGANCKSSLKWSTIINFSCSYESELIHVSTNFTSCTYIFQWETREACESLFERKSHCMVTHPQYSNIVYNLNDLKDQNFEVNDENGKFRFSICSPLQTPCNGFFDSAACFSFNGIETNIGLFTEEIGFDNGNIYMSMQGEKCEDSGPNSYTIIRFVCDYSNSKIIKIKKDLQECFFEFFIFTKNACTQNLKVSCTVDDQEGNIYNLRQLTKLNSNYEISINPMQTIILNVCHSVINNDINGTNCQLNSGVCLVDKNGLSSTSWYKNLGDVDSNSRPHKVGNKIILEMKNGFYDLHSVSSVIEFVCRKQSNNGYPVFMNEINHKFTFKWYTPLVCPVNNQYKKREIPEDKPYGEKNHEHYDNTVENHPRMETLTELGCSVSSFDLRPLKGNYLIKNKTNAKYYINMCMPGEYRIGGIMEYHGNNYSIGGQSTLKLDLGGNVNVRFKNSDLCPEKFSLGQSPKYSTKILWICSSIEQNPIVYVIKRCAVEFLWKTIYVCNKIMFEFNECKREAFIIGHSKDIKNVKTINMKNILNNIEFFDNSTQILFDVNFCNASVYLNKYLSFLSLEKLQYDVNKNQLNAYFKNIDHTGFSRMEIEIACSRTIDNNLSVPKVELINGEVKINMYSKGLCCINQAHHNEEMCKNVPLTDTLTTTISSIKNEENTLSTHFENYDNKPSETDSEDSVVLTKENIEESDLKNENNNAILQYYGTTELVDHFGDRPSVNKEESGFFFYLGVILMVLLLMSLIWLYRSKLLKKIRKLSYILTSARRRENYNRNLTDFY